jgi:ABC-type transport system involved in multi-copper enzyme maturation permease subunit
MNPIIRRELVEVLRTRKVLALQLSLGAACAILVLVRWPTGTVVELSGARALEVLRIFGYGSLAAILLLVPAFPATALVREKIKGTLALLLNSPLGPVSIYVGKLGGCLGIAAVLLTMTLPSAAACYVLGGTASHGGITVLYAILALTTLELATLGLLVSSRAQSIDGALRATYALVLGVCVLPLVPYALMRGGADVAARLAAWFRCLSPIPAIMHVLGQGDVGSHGISTDFDPVSRFMVLAVLVSLACALATVAVLRRTLLDRPRPSGVMTQDRSPAARIFRRVLFLVDPQRRSGSTSLWINPVMVKEFRSRRLGRSHWMLRLIGTSAVLSVGLSCVAVTGALGWGVEIIGGGLVLLQVALLILFAPSLAAGLVSSERESGSWQLLQMTPLSPVTILTGKLLSVLWPLLLLLCATLPGYLILTSLKPELAYQVERVVICLALTSVFTVLVSAAASTLFRSTALATTVSYLTLLAICALPLLIWLGRGAPFGHATVEGVLLFDPVAAALHASEAPGFAQYDLLPTNWWITGAASVALLLFIGLRMWQLWRPK